MDRLRWSLLLTVIPPLAASLLVLALGGVSRSVWINHLLAVGLAFVLAVAGRRFSRFAGGSSLAMAILLFTLAGLAVPLFGGGPGPNRWVVLGSLRVYQAPLWLPSFLAAGAVFARKRGNRDLPGYLAALAASILLAVQPDAAQLLALLAGSTVGFLRARSNPLKSAVTLIVAGTILTWAFSRPDPLQPVPYVEGVFELALDQSLAAGFAVVAGAFALVGGLWFLSRRGPFFWLSSVAAYYLVLYLCSLAGLTPAPIIGYGAGPILGFGLLVAVAQAIEPEAPTGGPPQAATPGGKA